MTCAGKDTCEGGTRYIGTSDPTDEDGRGGAAHLLYAIVVLRGEGGAVSRDHRPSRETIRGKQPQAAHTGQEEQRHHLLQLVGGAGVLNIIMGGALLQKKVGGE